MGFEKRSDPDKAYRRMSAAYQATAVENTRLRMMVRKRDLTTLVFGMIMGGACVASIVGGYLCLYWSL